MSAKPTVLIVEDLPNWQDTIQRLLGPDNYELVEATSLHAATTLLHSRVIDAAVVDIRLEDGDVTNTAGMFFLDELEKYYPEDRTHAVMLSGHGTIALATDAVTRSSRNVLAYIEKEKLPWETDRFVAEVARAVRATHEERARYQRAQVRSNLPPFFAQTIDQSGLATVLVPELPPLEADKEFGLVLRNLLSDKRPLAKGVKVGIDILPNSTDHIGHILCWSRGLVSALEISAGRRGGLKTLVPTSPWSAAGPRERISHWSTPHFDGILFGLSGISFEEYLTLVDPAS